MAETGWLWSKCWAGKANANPLLELRSADWGPPGGPISWLKCPYLGPGGAPGSRVECGGFCRARARCPRAQWCGRAMLWRTVKVSTFFKGRTVSVLQGRVLEERSLCGECPSPPLELPLLKTWYNTVLCHSTPLRHLVWQLPIYDDFIQSSCRRVSSVVPSWEG